MLIKCPLEMIKHKSYCTFLFSKTCSCFEVLEGEGQKKSFIFQISAIPSVINPNDAASATNPGSNKLVAPLMATGTLVLVCGDDVFSAAGVFIFVGREPASSLGLPLYILRVRIVTDAVCAGGGLGASCTLVGLSGS